MDKVQEAESDGSGKIDFNESSREFTELFNQLKYHEDLPVSNEVRMLLQTICIFFIRRFEYEESVMTDSDSPDHSVHKQQHALFLDNLTWSIQLCKRSNRVSKDLCLFLRKWFYFHSEHVDRPLYEAQMTGAKPASC